MVGQNAWIAVYIMASGRNGTLYTGVTRLALIEAENPQWRDLSEGWFEVPEGPLSWTQREQR